MLENGGGRQIVRDVMNVPPFLSKETINVDQFLQAFFEDGKVYTSFAFLVDSRRSGWSCAYLVFQILPTLSLRS